MVFFISCDVVFNVFLLSVTDALLNWVTVLDVLWIIKTASKKTRALIRSMKFQPPYVAHCLYILSGLRIVFTYYRALHGNSYHNWSGTPNCFLVILNILGKLQQWVCKTSGITLAFYETLANLQNMASMIVF